MEKKKILFRVDAGGSIGLGHFYRSYTLAQALNKKGYTITFSYAKSDFWNSLEHFDFEKIELEEGKEEESMIAICLDKQFQKLYVDGIINFKKDNIDKIKNRCTIIFYQNVSESRYLSDIYILPSIHQDHHFFNKFDLNNTQIYQGLEYFTFNSEISKLKPKDLSVNDNVSEIGIIAGGSDPKNVALKLYNLINYRQWNNIKFNFFLGDNYMHLKTIPRHYPKNVTFLTYNIEAIYKSDLLISAFGVSTYEFMALGLPIISLGHQESNAKAAEILEKKTKALYYLGAINSLSKNQVNDSIGLLVNNSNKRKEMSSISKTKLDFEGINRIVNIIENN